MFLGERLKKARESTGLSQEAFGDRCGVSKRAQINFEKGHQLPGAAYLMELADQFGFDPGYLLTGNDSQSTTADERELIDLFRAASPSTRAQVLSALRISAPPPPARQYTNHFNGTVQSVIQGDQTNNGSVTFNVGDKKRGARD